MKRYLAALLVVLAVVGVVGVLAVGRGFADEENADEENAAGAKCSEATLDGMYLFAFDGSTIEGKDQGPFAVAGYDVFDGNGHLKSVDSFNSNGSVGRKVHNSGTYTVKADCTGTATYGGGVKIDLFIAPDGSMYTWVQVEPKSDVTSGFELQGTAKRVGP
jgi:hypothetical protein